jgi:superfamily I DNA and/or RNA helicase
VLRRLYRQIGSERFDAARSIGIIVTYRHQIAMIRREMAQLGLPQLETITIDTVERYQGSQRDVIIYSTGVQDLDGLEFLTSNCFEEDGHVIDRKLNVAMTRARKQLIMTGNAGLLRKNEIFSELIARYSI